MIYDDIKAMIYCLEESVMDVDEPNPYFPQTEYLKFDQALKAKTFFEPSFNHFF